MSERKLSLYDLVVMGVGSIIGSGIFAMVGTGIELTGKSMSLALVLGCFVNLILCIPFLFTAGVTDVRGGVYGMAKVLLGKKWGGLFGILQVVSNFIIAIYCISIMQYTAQLVPIVGEYPKVFATFVLVFFFIVSLSGTKNMARLQGVFVIIMMVILFLFVVYGSRQLEPGYFSSDDFFLAGYSGFLKAIAVLTFASMGANLLINYFDVSKNPRRDLPLSILISTVIVAVVYFLVGVVASGVLPVSETAGKTLGVVAKVVLPDALFIVFIIGGAIFALASTLNNILAYVKYPIIALSEDRLLPGLLLKTNKYGYHYLIMLILFTFGLIPIVTSLKIDEIVSIVFGPSYVMLAIMAWKTTSLPDMFPDEWRNSPYKMPKPVLTVLSIICAILYVITGILLITNLSQALQIASIVFSILAIIYIAFRKEKTEKALSM